MDNSKKYLTPQEGGPAPFFGYVPARIPAAYDVVNVSEDPWGECVPALVVPLTDAIPPALAIAIAVFLATRGIEPHEDGKAVAA